MDTQKVILSSDAGPFSVDVPMDIYNDQAKKKRLLLESEFV